MIKRILFFGAFFCFGFLVPAFSQVAPDIMWQHSYGGTYNDDAYSISQTIDGGFIVAGAAASGDGDVLKLSDVMHGGDFDYWIAKLDPASNIQWKKRIGGTSSEILSTIYEVPGGYVVGGHAESNDVDVSGNHGQFDFWIVKLFASGSIQWSKCFGGTDDEFLGCVKPTNDGALIMCGSTRSNDGNVAGNHGSGDFWVVKSDPNGMLQWQKCLGGTGFEKANYIIPTLDGGYCLVGYTESNDGDVSGNHGDYDGWIVKIDGSGSMQWQKCFGGTKLDNLNSVAELDDGSFIATGYAESNDGDLSGNHGQSDVWLLKIDASGNFLWSRCLGGSLADVGSVVQIADSGQIVISGYAASSDGNCTNNYGLNDFWLVKTDSSGNVLWQKNYGGSESEACFAMRITNDKGYILAGNSSSTDFNVTGNHGQRDYWVAKIDNIVGINEIVNDEAFTIFPQPANEVITIKFTSSYVPNQNLLVEIEDLRGRAIISYTSISNEQITIDISAFHSGIYLMKVGDGKKRMVKKFVKQ